MGAKIHIFFELANYYFARQLGRLLMMQRGRRNSKSQRISCAWFLVNYVKLSGFMKMVWFSMVLKRGGRRIEEGRKRGVF